MNREPEPRAQAASSRVKEVLLSTRYDALRSVVDEHAPMWRTAENFPKAVGLCASLARRSAPST